MTTVLLTAFEPYGPWKENSSWLTLVELTRELPATPKITTRLYPVAFPRVRERLWQDLSAGYDYALHLGQFPGAAAIRLEAFALNGYTEPELQNEPPAYITPLAPDGPAAYRANLPLDKWAQQIRAAGVPAVVSYHAGVYLCNAMLYVSRHFCTSQGLPTRSGFLHLPLIPAQVLHPSHELPTVPLPLLANALRTILESLATKPSVPAPR
jgi:pyroglutamyl-peptidase